MGTMDKINQLLQFYSSGLSQEYNKIVEPLNDYFLLNSFTYSVSTPEGYFFQISNDPSLGIFYFSNHLYRFNPFICHPDNYYHNQTLITGDFPHKPFQRAQQLVKKHYGLENFLNVYKKENDFAHIFMFSSTHAEVPLTTVFVNNRALLNKFCDYFMLEWRKNHLRMEPYMINLGELMGSKYFAINPLFKSNPEKIKKIQFLRKINQINDQMITPVNFSPREITCIDYFLKGKSAREIGEITGLSRRTVEHYLENIKSKVGCFSKSELFTRLDEYKHLELI